MCLQSLESICNYTLSQANLIGILAEEEDQIGN